MSSKHALVFVALLFLGSSGLVVGQSVVLPPIVTVSDVFDQFAVYAVRYPDGNAEYVVGLEKLRERLALYKAFTGGKAPDPFIPPVVRVLEKIGSLITYGIDYPDGNGEIVTGDALLTAKVKAYANSYKTPYGSSVPSGSTSGNTSKGGSSALDDIDKELEGFLGTKVDEIKSGITAEITSQVSSLVSGLVDASPIGEVNSLKDLLKDVYGKQLKIEYQQYKTAYENKKAKTTLSKGLIDYYKAINLPTIIARINTEAILVKKAASRSTLGPNARTNVARQAEAYASVDDIENDINTAVNDKEVVWMSTAERSKVLDVCRDELMQKLIALRQLRGSLAANIRGNAASKLRSQTMKGLYRNGSSVSRYTMD